MNIVVIGLGSMGKRRIRLIQELYPEYRIIGVNKSPERRKEVSDLFGITCVDSIANVEIGIDCAFVCTAPLTHSSIITECLQRKWHVFTELNLIDDGYEQNIQLAKNNGIKLFLSSTFLYREEPRYIRSRINNDQKWNYIYHIGQYLPDWHPWENYKSNFLADKRTNGCREILAIELPWLLASFGEIESLHAESDKMTDLGIDYNDNFMIHFRHKNGNKGTLIVDVVSPCAVRKFEAYAEGHYIAWNGTPESLQEYNSESGKLENIELSEITEHKDGYRSFITENAYKNEIQEFINVVNDNKLPIYTFEQDLNTLRIINTIGA